MENNMSVSIKINNREIGPDFLPLVLAEVGINHDGNFDKAICLVDAASKVGAEVVKFQTHITAKEMIKTDMKPGDISDESLWDIIKKCELTEEEEIKIQKYCMTKNITYLSTPFSREAADRLENMGVSAFKVGSGECNNLPLISHIASKRRPIILSTGMNDIDSIARTVKIIESYQCPLAILHCTSMYPTPYANVRLGAIEDLKNNFKNHPIGLSDHSIGIETCLGAVALGACILEKHFTISREWPGPDTSISIEPEELRNLINGSIKIWEARGGKKNILPQEKQVIDFAYASIVSIKSIKVGDVFSIDNIWVKRPGNGKLLANNYDKIIGMVAKNDINMDEQISPENIVGYKE
jgi:sialic acid synthase SpsE